MRNAPSNETVLARRIQQHVIPLAEGRQHVFLHPPDQHLQFPANGLHGILEIALLKVTGWSAARRMPIMVRPVKNG